MAFTEHQSRPQGATCPLNLSLSEGLMPYKTFFRLGVALALICLCFTAVEAKIVTKTVAYKQDGTVLQGFLAYDEDLKGKRPGVLVVHEWWGLNDFARERAVKLAGLGYVALAADMYGGGATTTDRQEAGKLAGALISNPDLLRARAQAALKVLAADPRVDPQPKLSSESRKSTSSIMTSMPFGMSPLMLRKPWLFPSSVPMGQGNPRSSIQLQAF